MKKTAEFSAVFPILCDFLVALLPSAVPLYVDDGKITPSASKLSNPSIEGFNYLLKYLLHTLGCGVSLLLLYARKLNKADSKALCGVFHTVNDLGLDVAICNEHELCVGVFVFLSPP